MNPADKHTLEIVTWRPLHAECSCGAWSMLCMVKGFLTLEEAMQEAEESHAAHVQDMDRRQALRQTIYTKDTP